MTSSRLPIVFLVLSLLLCLLSLSSSTSPHIHRDERSPLRGGDDPPAVSTPSSSSSNITLLDEGKAITTSVPPHYYDYYGFPVFSVSTVNITLHSLNGSDADLYASTVTVYPSITTYQWSSTSLGSDCILIPKAEIGLYYIAVYGWGPGKKGGQVEYTIIASTQ